MFRAMVSALIFAISFAAVATAQDSPSGERKHVGLIIGNSSYAGGESGLPALPNACSDAQRVAARLVTIGWDETAEIDLQCNLTVDQMADHVRGFVAKMNEDPYAIGVFYYAGHAVQVDSRQFIFGTDARPNLATARRQIDRNPDSRLFVGSALDLYADFFQGVGAVTDGGLTIIIDACRSDPIIRSINGDGVRRVTAPTVRTTLLPGILIALSTQNGEPAMDGGGAVGPYAEALSRLIVRDRDIARILHDVSINVWTKTKVQFPTHPQIPTWTGGTAFPCFAGCVSSQGNSASADLPAPANPVEIVSPPFEQVAIGRVPAASQLFRMAAWSSTQNILATQLPAPSAPAPGKDRALSSSLWKRGDLDMVRQPDGVRFEIFWCEAGERGPEREALAARYGSLLSEAGSKSRNVASVRLRILTRTGNSLPAHRFIENVVVYDSNNPHIRQWVGRIHASGVTPLISINSPETPNYVAIYICQADVPTAPAKVSWQVPSEKKLIYAKLLINGLDEKGGHFVSESQIEAVESSPDLTQVRYFHDADQAVAYRLADSLQIMLGHDVPARYFAPTDVTRVPDAGKIEVWLGKNESGQGGLLPLSSIFTSATKAPSRNETVKRPDQ